MENIPEEAVCSCHGRLCYEAAKSVVVQKRRHYWTGTGWNGVLVDQQSDRLCARPFSQLAVVVKGACPQQNTGIKNRWYGSVRKQWTDLVYNFEVPLPNGEVAPSGSWLYGKIGNRYGSLPAQYVVPLDDNNVRSPSVWQWLSVQLLMLTLCS